MTSWFESVDIYCERLGPGFWAEPANALSNLAFVAAGLWFYGQAHRLQSDRWVKVLALWVVAIGIGSFLFHTFANHITELLDVVPIWSFVAVYIVFALRRMFGFSWVRVLRVLAVTLVVVGVMVNLFMGNNDGALNGSLQYLPALIALVVFSVALKSSQKDGAGYVVAATATFLVSLAFRTLDRDLCPSWPLGTHFLWHVFNALMLAFLLAAALRHRRAGLGG